MNKVIDNGFRSCRFVSTIVKHPVLYVWKWHYDQIGLSFFGHFKKLRSVIEKSQKNQVETQSREMFLIFRTTPLVVRCMAAVPLVATALCTSSNEIHGFQLTHSSWRRWLEQLSKLPRLRQHNSTMIFVSWSANLQHKINWTSSKIYVISSS